MAFCELDEVYFWKSESLYVVNFRYLNFIFEINFRAFENFNWWKIVLKSILVFTFETPNEYYKLTIATSAVEINQLFIV